MIKPADNFVIQKWLSFEQCTHVVPTGAPYAAPELKSLEVLPMLKGERMIKDKFYRKVQEGPVLLKLYFEDLAIVYMYLQNGQE